VVDLAAADLERVEWDAHCQGIERVPPDIDAIMQSA
jgi:hypothetical protein